MDLPVFLMGFANDRKGEYLRGIAKEQDAIRDALSNRDHLCELVPISDLSLDKLLDKISETPPTLFHYGGHADGDHLLFGNNQRANADSLAKLITTFSGVELVFLNGCATYEQAMKFHQQGVRHVVVTNKKINDETAVRFAFRFYEALTEGKDVEASFEWAKNSLLAGMKQNRGSRNTSLFVKEKQSNAHLIPWELISDTQRPPWKWTEPQIRAKGRVLEEEIDGEGLSGVKIRKGTEFQDRTDEEGYFAIELKKSHLGRKFKLSVDKDQFRVVNKEALYIVPEIDFDQKELLVEIVMSPPNKLRESILAFNRISYTNTIKIKSAKSGEITSPEEERATAQIANLAAHDHSVDLDEIKEGTAKDNYVEAKKWINKGEIEKALEALEEDELMQNLTEAKEQEQAAQASKQLVVDSLLLKATAYILNFEFAAAERCYQKAMEANPDDFSIQQRYLTFLYKQNHYSKAKRLSANSLDHIQDQLDEYLSEKAELLHDQGRIHFKENEFEQAETCFTEAIKTREELSHNRASKFQALQQQIKGPLAELNKMYQAPEHFQKKKADALLATISALQAKLHDLDQDQIDAKQAATYNNLGKFHLTRQNFPQAKAFLEQSLAIDERLAAKPNMRAVFSPYIAINFNDLGETYAYDWNPDKPGEHFPAAEEHFLKALSIRETLAKAQPDTYKPDWAETLVNLGKLFYYEGKGDKQQYDTSLAYYQQALEIQQPLAEQNPSAFQPNLSETYHLMGKLHRKMKNNEDAKANYQKAENIRQQLMSGHPEAYKDEYAATLANYGVLLKEIDELEEAEKRLTKALELDRELAEMDAQSYGFYIPRGQLDLGWLYYKQKRYSEALEQFEQVLTNGLDEKRAYLSKSAKRGQSLAKKKQKEQKAKK
ncbi:MAG: tetratricopeptide repeat protein [Bacteroidota bacterium]